MKALGYFLTETAPTKGPHSNLNDLEKAFLSFCEQQGFEPVANFIDVAGDPLHPHYKKLLQRLGQSSQGFEVVVVQRLDDLGVDGGETARRIIELEETGARVVSMDSPDEEALRKALEMRSVGKRRETMSQRVKGGMRQQAMKGLGMGKPPFGYRIGLERRFEVVAEEGAVVQLIYKLYVDERLGIRLIARNLNERGIRTRSGRRWSVVSIRDILRNRTYLGTYSRFGIRVPGNHHPIISQELFRKAQQGLGSRRSPLTGATSPFLLSGLLYCGYCGNRMIGVSRHQSWTRRTDGSKATGHYRYYQCASRTNQSVCHYHTQRAEELENQVLEQLRGYLGAGKLEELAGQGQVSVEDSSGERRKLKSRLRALSNRLDRYMTQVSDREMTLEQLRDAGGRIIEEQRGVEERLRQLEVQANQRIETGLRQEQLLSALGKLRDGWEELTISSRRALLKDVLDRVVAYDERIETKLKF